MIVDALRRAGMLAALPRRELDRLAAKAHLVTYAPGDLLLREGHSDDCLLILAEGEVEIVKALGTADERRLAVCQPGALLGEMSLFSSDGAHTASVRALGPVRALQVGRADFDGLLQRQPRLAYGLVRLLCQRLDEGEHVTIRDLSAKNRQLAQAYHELEAAQAQLIEAERLERELEIARDIQRSMLPQHLPQVPGYDVGALMVPARLVGGDFYDVIPLDDHRLALVVGDVCGKGVPAALFMAQSFSLLHAEASRDLTPGETLRAVNRHLLSVNTSQMFVTLLYGVLDCATGRLAYARAGHPPPLLLDGSRRPVQLPLAPGQLLGLFDKPLLDEQSLAFPPGGLLLFYSDGLSEATDAQGMEWDMPRVGELLGTYGAANGQQICDRLWQDVQGTAGPAGPQDDCTLLAIRAQPTLEVP